MRNIVKKIYRRSCTACATEHFFIEALALAIGWLISAILSYIMDEKWSGLWKLSVAALFSIVAIAIFERVVKNRNARLIAESKQEYRERLCKEYIEQNGYAATDGEILVQMEKEADTIADYYTRSLPKTIVAVIIGLACSALLIMQQWKLGLVFVLMAFLQLLPALIYQKWAKRIYENAVSSDEAFSDWIINGIKGITTIKSYRQEEWFLTRLKACRLNIVAAAKKENTAATVEDIVSEFVRTVLQDGTYLILGLATIARVINVTAIPIMIVLTQHLFSAAETIVRAGVARGRYQQAMTHLRVYDRAQALSTGAQEGAAILKSFGISKSYEGKEVLQETSVQINPGDRILLQGANGSGKTTLMRILLGIERPDTGSVYSRIPRIAFALQEDPMVTTTLGAFAEDMIERGVISGSKFKEHIQGFSISEILEQEASECSAGQLKKFFLAIAFSIDSPLLVLDEPTNHIDENATEYLLRIISEKESAMLICTHDERIKMPIVWRTEGGVLYEEY